MAGCANIPEVYAPPIQRKTLEGPDPTSLRPFIRANETGAIAHYLKDVSANAEGTFRWTKQRPTFQFQLLSPLNQKLKFDFVLHPDVMTKLGPITVTYYINGKVFDKVRYDKVGDQHYLQAVAPELLSTAQPTIVSAELDKVLQTPDGNQLGLVLLGCGFVQ